MLQIIVLLMIFFPSAINADEKKEEYKYFPKYWPKHKEIRQLDEYIEKYSLSTGENPLFKKKKGKHYRIFNHMGIISIHIDENKVCEINYHRNNKAHLFPKKSLSKTTHFSVGGIKNCETIAELQTLESIINGYEISLPIGFLSGEFLWPSGMNVLETKNLYGERRYNLKLVWNQKEIETLKNYYRKIFKIFEKYGIKANCVMCKK